MKTQRILGVLWLAFCSFIVAFWLWKFITKAEPRVGYFQAVASLVFLFGAIASIFLFRGARWARISVGIIALSTALIVILEICQQGWPKFDGYFGILGLVSAVILLFPRHETVA
jgi:hypothetical protein